MLWFLISLFKESIYKSTFILLIINFDFTITMRLSFRLSMQSRINFIIIKSKEWCLLIIIFIFFIINLIIFIIYTFTLRIFILLLIMNNNFILLRYWSFNLRFYSWTTILFNNLRWPLMRKLSLLSLWNTFTFPTCLFVLLLFLNL